ncbi:MAG: hypothetical protein M5U29_01115 [Anaerolineae bacterium]|nr:hypothetical protein [Anaerolineae bacterium]
MSAPLIRRTARYVRILRDYPDRRRASGRGGPPFAGPVHDAEREAFPWRGTALAMRLVRFMSVLMGLGTVLLAYLLGRELFPVAPAIALGAATFTAFNPMFLFISGVINNLRRADGAHRRLVVLA